MTAAEYQQMKQEQAARLAAKGRDWLKAHAAEVKAAMGHQRIEGRKDGTYASLEGQLEALRAAWRLAR